jgi:CelD/BcsL family acetyltransferase involved in cellulose biosynthesis
MHAPLAVKLDTEWKPFAALDAVVDEWRDLAARALEPNIFYEPAFARPAAEIFGAKAGAVLVRTPSGRLVGLLPIERKAFGLAAGYVHPYAPLGTPLIDRDEPEAVIEAMLDHLSREANGVLLPLIPEGAFARALGRVAERRHFASARLGDYHRAMLEPGAAREHYLDHGATTKGRKGLIRRRKRLSELGDLSHYTVREADAMKGMVAAFLKLEDSGWKGRAGTAAQRDPALAAFVEGAMTALARERKAYGEVLSLNGAPIAATLIMRSGNTAWAWKIAFDETYARCSPGMQIALEATKTLLADHTIVRTDSCTPPDLPMIDHLWRERLAVADRLIGLKAGHTPAFKFHLMREQARRAATAHAKAALRRLGLR